MIRSPGAGTDVVVVGLAATVVVVVGLAFGDANVRGVTEPRAMVGEPPDTASAEALSATIAVIATRSCRTNVVYP